MIDVHTSASLLFNRLSWLFKGKADHPLIADNHRAFRRFDQDRPLEEYSFVVVDTELTGLNSKLHEIVSIGAVRISNLEINPNDFFSQLIRPSGKSHKEAILIHGLTPSDLSSAEPLDQVLPRFLDYLGGSLMVGHHVGLDVSFINRACKKILGGRLMTPCVDTLLLARSYQEERFRSHYDKFTKRISYTLPDLARTYGMPEFTAHDAAFDALQAAYLFLFLVKKLRGGESGTLRDLYRVGRRWRMNY